MAEGGSEAVVIRRDGGRKGGKWGGGEVEGCVANRATITIRICIVTKAEGIGDGGVTVGGRRGSIVTRARASGAHAIGLGAAESHIAVSVIDA